MAIEIRELIIKTTVTDQSVSPPNGSVSPKDLENIKNDIISECIDKIMEELNKTKER